MQSRVIGRYRQSNGGIVRCDVEAERALRQPLHSDDGGRGVVQNAPKAPSGSSKSERNESARDARPRFGVMLSL